MDTTVGQDMNCPTDFAMLLLVFFIRRKKKKYIYWKVRLHCAHEEKQRITLQDFPRKGKYKKEACGRLFNNSNNNNNNKILLKYLI